MAITPGIITIEQLNNDGSVFRTATFRFRSPEERNGHIDRIHGAYNMNHTRVTVTEPVDVRRKARGVVR
jgi:hypothetical protein